MRHQGLLQLQAAECPMGEGALRGVWELCLLPAASAGCRQEELPRCRRPHASSIPSGTDLLPRFPAGAFRAQLPTLTVTWTLFPSSRAAATPSRNSASSTHLTSTPWPGPAGREQSAVFWARRTGGTRFPPGPGEFRGVHCRLSERLSDVPANLICSEEPGLPAGDPAALTGPHPAYIKPRPGTRAPLNALPAAAMEPVGAASVLLALCLSCLVLLAAWRRALRKGRLPPGPAPLPILGNALQLKTSNLAQTFQELSEQYGPVFTLYVGAERVVALHGYEAIKEALIDRGEEFVARGSLPLADKINQGLGIVFSNGERWKQLRRFALTTLRNFGMGKKSIEGRIQEEARHLLEELQGTQGRPFDPTFLLSPAFSNIICSIVFGRRYEYEDKRFLALMNLLSDNFKVFSSPWGQIYNTFPSVMGLIPGPHHSLFENVERVKEFVLEEVKAHQSTMDPSEPRDFIDCFLMKLETERHKGASEFTTENLVMSTMDLFSAGTETSSNTLRFGLLILLKFPEIQEKVHEEIDSVVGRARQPCIADRGQMPYTDAVLHEIQRFISLIPLSLPHAVLKDTPFRQYVIPKGTTIYPVLSSVLYDGREFPNPRAFDPRHFLHEDGRFRKSDYFMPFSAGKRICAGEGLARMELFLFFTTILQSFALKPLVHPEDIDLTPQFSGFGNIPQVYQLRVLPR